MIKIKPINIQNVEKNVQKRMIKSKLIPNCNFSCEEKGFFLVDGRPVKIIFPR